MTRGRRAPRGALLAWVGPLGLLVLGCDREAVTESGPEGHGEAVLEVHEPAPPVPPAGRPERARLAEADAPLHQRPFHPVPIRWRPPGELAPSLLPEGHPLAERGGGPRPEPVPPRNARGRSVYRVDSLPLPGGPMRVRSELYESAPRFPAPFHTYLPEGFVVDEIGSTRGFAVRFADGREPGDAGPPSVSLFLFHEEETLETAVEVAEGIAESRALSEPEEGPEVAWAVRTFSFESHTQEGWVAVADLEGRPLVWTVQSPADRWGDFQVKVDVLLSGWRWGDGDRPFSAPLR